MHISWIDVMLQFFLLLFVLSSVVHGKAFLEDAPGEGKQNYYSEIRHQYQPAYDPQNYAANPKLFYTPQIDGQPIYIPAISGSEHANKFLDDYYKINRDYKQSWTLAPPVTYDYDITSESSYYENGAITNSMVKNFLEEKYKDGAYSSYIMPPTSGNVPKHEVKTTDQKTVIEHKDPGGKKTHNRKKKRPHGVSTESYFTQHKIRTEIPDYSKVLTKPDYEKQGKSPVSVKSAIPGADDYDEMDQISTFEVKGDKTKDKHIKKGMDYSEGIKTRKEKLKKDKPQSSKHKNKSKGEPVSKPYAEDHVTNSHNLKPSKKEKTTVASEYSNNKIKNEVSVGKNKPKVDVINKLSDDDYEPAVINVINEKDYDPEVVDIINEDDNDLEVVDVINELSDEDYEPDVLNENDLSDDYQQDEEVIKIPKTEEHFVTDDESTNHFSSNKDKKKNKNKSENNSVYSQVEKEKPKKVKHQSVKVHNKPNKHLEKDVKDSTSDMNNYKTETVQSPKADSKKTKDKLPVDSYEPDDVGQVSKLSVDQESEDELELTDDYVPEVVDVVNKLSEDGEMQEENESELSDDAEIQDENASELSDIDELDSGVAIIDEENFKVSKPGIHLENHDTDLDTYTSEKDEAKPSKPVKTKPIKVKPSKPVKTKPIKVKPSKPVKTKPIKVKPSKPVKTKPIKVKPSKPEKIKDHIENTDKYDGSEIKSTNLKETQPPKIEKDESKGKYESEHATKEKDQIPLADESVIESQTDDLQEIHSRNLLTEPTDILSEVEEFDGSGSQATDTNMRSIPQFFKNVESIRNLTSLNSNIWSLIFNPNAERNELKRCVTRSNETGICMYVQQCEVPNIAASLEQLLNNACVIDDMFIGVCCPEFPVQTVKVHWDEMPSNSEKLSEDEFGHSAEDCGIRSDDAKATESWPWQAPLVSMSNGKIFCGGVIINDDYILTAAHCTTKIPKNQILVRLGQHDETSGDDFAVVEIKRHAQYNPRTMHNDIALLKLGKRIMRDKLVDAVCLPEDDDDDDHEDEEAVLLGRKGIFSQSSKPTEWLKIMSNDDCGKKLGSKVPATLLCTDARDENERTCNLDSGAPLVVEDDGKYEVIGILSWNRNDCDERFPSTFSRVSKFVRWIKKHAV